MKICNILHGRLCCSRQGSLQFNPSLLFYASKRSDRNLPFWIRHHNPSFSRRVLELFMAAKLSNLVPTIPFQPPDDLAAIHRSLLIAVSLRIHTFTHCFKSALAGAGELKAEGFVLGRASRFEIAISAAEKKHPERPAVEHSRRLWPVRQHAFWDISVSGWHDPARTVASQSRIPRR